MCANSLVELKIKLAPPLTLQVNSPTATDVVGAGVNCIALIFLASLLDEP